MLCIDGYNTYDSCGCQIVATLPSVFKILNNAACTSPRAQEYCGYCMYRKAKK